MKKKVVGLCCALLLLAVGCTAPKTEQVSPASADSVVQTTGTDRTVTFDTFDPTAFTRLYTVKSTADISAFCEQTKTKPALRIEAPVFV